MIKGMDGHIVSIIPNIRRALVNWGNDCAWMDYSQDDASLFEDAQQTSGTLTLLTEMSIEKIDGMQINRYTVLHAQVRGPIPSITSQDAVESAMKILGGR